MRLKLVPTVVLLAAVMLTGCSASVTSTDEMSEPSLVSPDMEQFVPSSEGGAVSDANSRVDGSDAMQIVTGYLTLTVENPAEAAADVARIVEQAGGRVDARSEQAPDGDIKGRAQLTVRIPTTALTATLESLKKLGEVEQLEQDQQNVSSEVRDLESRIKALRTSVDRLIALMAEADTTADLIAIESALSERQANLESLESQKRSLDDLVQLSTYTIHLGTEADAPVDEPDTFLSGLAAGWDAFVGFFSFLLVALGVLLPWLALAAVIAVVVVALVRRRSKSAQPTAATGEGL